MYRIYTQDVNGADIRTIVSRHCSGYTILHAQGAWKGVTEDSLVIELAFESTPESLQLQAVKTLAQEIKTFNKQEAVLVTYQPQTSELV